MKLSEYLSLAILLIPTVVVVLAAVVSLASDPVPEYHPPFKVVSSAGLYPADMTTDE